MTRIGHEHSKNTGQTLDRHWANTGRKLDRSRTIRDDIGKSSTEELLQDWVGVADQETSDSATLGFRRY